MATYLMITAGGYNGNDFQVAVPTTFMLAEPVPTSPLVTMLALAAAGTFQSPINVTSVANTGSTIVVTTDTAVNYNGVFSNSGSSYSIAQPTQDATLKLLTIPITVVPTVPNITSIASNTSGQIVLNFDNNIGTVAVPTSQPVPAIQLSGASKVGNVVTLASTFSGGLGILSIVGADFSLAIRFSGTLVSNSNVLNPANWSINPVGSSAAPMAVLGVSLSNDTITLTTTEATNGQTYAVVIPGSYVLGTSGFTYAGTPTQNFTGVGKPPFVVNSIGVNNRTVDVIFNKDVDPTTAGTASNYTFSPVVSVLSVARLAGAYYRLTVDGYRSTQSYSLTVSNVKDLVGNVI